MPFFSYIAKRKNGIMTTIMMSVATLMLTADRSRKKIGTPASAPRLKQKSCRLVRLKMTFVLILVRSFGTGT